VRQYIKTNYWKILAAVLKVMVVMQAYTLAISHPKKRKEFQS